MEHVFLFSLAVVTLLQLCRAELPGSWYSANVINGNGEFSPKPISEIFSTTNPIVVLPPSTPSPIEPYSTSAQTASSPFSSTTSPFSSTVSPFSSTVSPFSSSVSTLDYVSSTQSSFPTETSFETQPTRQSTLPQQWTPSQPSTQTLRPTIQQESMELKPFPFPMILQPQPQPQPNNPQQNLPNYFLIYQQAPQTVQNFPTPTAQQTNPSPSSFPTQPTFTQSSTFSPEPTSFRPDLSSFQPDSTSFQPDLSSFRPDSTTFRPDSTTFRPELSTPQLQQQSTPQTTLSTFQPDSASTFPTNWPNRSPYSSTPFASTAFPCDSNGRPLNPLSQFPSLRIRVAAPSGSITNINLNPTASTTTRRPTTTRRITTTRTRRTKRNRNSYDGCVNACDGRRSPICASPLSAKQIDPDSLKRFPSVCHMACHNSFRKNQYEMLVEGRCGRLRTRIRTVDSTNKLKRDELNKVQYTIVDNPQTVLEFASLLR